MTGKGALAVGVDGLPPFADLLGGDAELSGGLGDIAGVAGESDGLAFELGRVLFAGTVNGSEKGWRVGRFLPSAKLRPSQDPDPLKRYVTHVQPIKALFVSGTARHPRASLPPDPCISRHSRPQV